MQALHGDLVDQCVPSLSIRWRICGNENRTRDGLEGPAIGFTAGVERLVGCPIGRGFGRVG